MATSISASTPARVIARNTASLLLSDFFARLLWAATSVVIARYLGANDFAILSVAMAFSSIAGYFTDAGLTQTVIRDGTKPGTDLAALVKTALKLRIAFAALAAAGSVAAIQTLYAPGMRLVLYVVVIPTLCGWTFQGIGRAYFSATQQMHYSSLISVAATLTTVLALATAIIFKTSLPLIATIYGFSSLIGGGLSVYLLCRHISPRGRWYPGLTRGLTAFAIAGLVTTILPQLGPIILQRVTALTQVGYFAAGTRIPYALLGVPTTVTLAFYPQLFHLSTRSQKQLRELSKIEVKIVAILGLLMALPLAVHPELVIQYLLGANWVGETAPALRIAALTLAVASVNVAIGDAITTAGHQPRRMIALLIATLVTLCLYPVLGHSMGARGGAAAALLGQVALTLAYVASLRERAADWFAAVLKPLTAVVPTIIGLWCLGKLGLSDFAAVLAAAPAFAIAVLFGDRQLLTQTKTAARSAIPYFRHWLRSCAE